MAAIFVAPLPAQVRRAPKRVPPRVIERLENMKPEEREKALSRLPAPRRAQEERRLDQYERLTPEQREQAKRRLEQFQSLPVERRAAVRRELQILRLMNAEDRKQRLGDPKFQERYPPQELQLLKDSLGGP